MSQCMTKPTKWHVCPAKTLISLAICPFWSESSLSARRKLGSFATQMACAPSNNSDQPGHVPILISLRCPQEESLGPLLPKWHVHPATTQISLAMCPLWSVFAVRKKKAWVLCYPNGMCTQQKLRSAWPCAFAQADLRWSHKPYCRFCQALAQISILLGWRKCLNWRYEVNFGCSFTEYKFLQLLWNISADKLSIRHIFA